ncbi:DUF4358 domain-containing protein [Sporosarcina aquimarina]|uniref:DUF4358 domain-containing protein n=1 Tax=Sporosarcina aquimarina TaxID=114975 RepID=A0ABU4G0S2_9BACL|nr:DUF4358 domain-containing protein [Sporosarcina aquimarina]MDW0110563.1 DUF4358 domain-containing protein [Sporosarcina aquimarina]
MKKLAAIAVVFMAVLMAACGNQDKDNTGKEQNAEPEFADIITNIKEQVAKDMEVENVNDLNQYYQEVNLTEREDGDSASDIWVEKMKVNPELLANGTVLAALMNVNADEIIVLEAKDEDQVDELKSSLENELAAQDQTWKQYLPEQYEKVKNNKIVTKGKFLLYVTYTNPEEIEKTFNESF